MRRPLGVALAGVALTLAAFTFDTAPLFAAGVAFVLLGLLAQGWAVLAARNAQISRRLSADRAMEEEPVEARISLGVTTVGSPSPEVLDPLLDHPVSIRRRRGSSPPAEVRIVARFPRRGLQRLPPPSLVVRDPFGLARVERPARSGFQELLILPRTEPIHWVGHAGSEPINRLLSPAPGERLAAAEVEGLRPYREGAPASRIHWPALARGQGLLERRLRSDGNVHPLVVLDARGDGPSEHLDQAVRAAASLVRALARSGGCRILLPGERRPLAVEGDLTGWHAVHARLALVDPLPPGPSPVAPAAAMSDTLLWVAASPPRLAPEQRQQLLVLPADVSAPGRPVLEVAGCRGYLG